MSDPILGVRDPCPEIYQSIGKVATEWAWIEMLLGEMLAHFCRADPGSMYVITQNVSAATITDWLRTLIQIKVKNDASATVILDVLKEVDDVRAERNTLVHGIWRAGDESGFGWVQTFRWERHEVARDELWSIADVKAVIDHLADLQLRLANLGVRMGFLKIDKR